MLKRNPQHRYNAIKDKKLDPEHEAERALYVLLHGPKAVEEKTPLKPWAENQLISNEVKYAHDVFNTRELRGLLEAFLLSTEDDYEVYKATGVTVDEIHCYRHLFFDTSVFRNDLDIMAFLRVMPDEDPIKELYKMAFHQGFRALRWNYCRDKGGVEAEEAMKVILSDTFYQFLANRGKPMTSKLAKEARDIAKTTISCVQTLNHARQVGNLGDNDDDEKKGLRFLFESARPNKTVQQVQKDGTKVVH